MDIIHTVQKSGDGVRSALTIHNDTIRSTTTVVFHMLPIFPVEATDISDLQIETEIVFWHEIVKTSTTGQRLRKSKNLPNFENGGKIEGFEKFFPI